MGSAGAARPAPSETPWLVLEAAPGPVVDELEPPPPSRFTLPLGEASRLKPWLEPPPPRRLTLPLGEAGGEREFDLREERRRGYGVG